MDLWEYVLLIVGGFAAGIINTLAGNGSAITLSLLIFTGLPADVANATNRIGATAQTLTAIGSLRRTPRTRYLMRDGLWFLIPSIVGSVIGALFAVEVDPDALRTIIGFVMLGLLFTMVTNPKKWARQTNPAKSHKTVLNWILIFGIAVYGGFLQMGIGIMLLSVLVLVAQYSLRDANIVKLMISVTFVVPAFLVFVYSGDIDWLSGLMLAIGQSIGAFIGARYILFMPKANLIIRWLLIIILSISAVVLLQLHVLLGQLFGT